MSSQQETTAADALDGKLPTDQEVWHPPELGTLDRVIERLGEWFNPILVKEARQALKSRQFVIAFALVLLAGWAWSIIGVSIFTPDIFYSARGQDMLAGYYWILSFPLLVIVPFGAFRSLAVEIEDGTFELMSVSTLTPLQIVSGKLGSAFVQGLVYFSALSPCIAFTYLLRGIDMTAILLLLFYTGFFSVCLSIAGLFLATISQSKIWQTFLTVGVTVGLFINFLWMTTTVTGVLLNGLVPVDWFGEESLAIQASIVTIIGSFAWLFFTAAAARITFPSENRSTRLRAIMIVQHVLFLAWLAYIHISFGDRFIVMGGVAVVAGYWYVMGALMLGESGKYSQRVLRTLPQSFMGRVLFNWFAPGRSTGFQFASLNALSATLFGVILLEVGMDYMADPITTIELRNSEMLLFAIASYCITYLAISRMIVAGVSAVGNVNSTLSLLVSAFVILFLSALPVLIRNSFDFYSGEYFYWEISNPVGTIRELGRGVLPNNPVAVSAKLANIKVILFATGICVYLCVTGFGARQILSLREEAPERVTDDDQELREQRDAKKGKQVGPVAHPLDAPE